MNIIMMGWGWVRRVVARLGLPALAVFVAACAGTTATTSQTSPTAAPSAPAVTAAPAAAAQATDGPMVQVSPVAGGTPVPKATLVQPKDGLPVKGAKEAPVRIFEFSDYQ